MFGTEVTCDETDETSSAAQFKDDFVFEKRRSSLEEIRAENLVIDAMIRFREHLDLIAKNYSPLQRARRSHHIQVRHRERVLLRFQDHQGLSRG